MHHSMTNILYPSHGMTSAWNNGFVQTPADLCANTTVSADKTVSLKARTCSRVALGR